MDHPITFHAGTIENISGQYDTAFVPYLLGVRNGIEDEADIVSFIRQLFKSVPGGAVIVNPARSVKEFYLVGARYLDTISYKGIQNIPGLKDWIIKEDPHWFKNQGIVVLTTKSGFTAYPAQTDNEIAKRL